MYRCPLCSRSDLTSNKVGSYPYYLCNECGLGSVPKLGGEEEYLKHYCKHHSDEEELYKLRHAQYQIDSDHFLSYLTNGKILDVGCSTGGFASLLYEKGNFDLITALDIDKGALKIAQKKLDVDSVEFVEAKATSFENRYLYDAVVFRGVFQYLGDSLDEMMKKILNMLRPRGYLFLYSVPNSESFIFKLKKEKWNLFNPIEHKLFFNTKSLVYLSHRYKLAIAELTFPYIETVYSDIEKDYQEVIDVINNPDKTKDLHPAFWGNTIRAVFHNKSVVQGILSEK